MKDLTQTIIKQMSTGIFIIDNEELIEKLFVRNIQLSSSIPIYYNDDLTTPVGYAEKVTDGDSARPIELCCHVKEEIMNKYSNGDLDFRFGYNLSKADDNKRQIDLNFLNLVPR